MTFPPNLQHLIREQELLAPYCWLQMGGPARYFAEPNTIDDLCGLISEASRQSLPIRLLGDGSNILVREEGIEALVIRLATAELCRIEISGSKLVARAGARLSHVISAAVGAGLGGLEHLAGIPGTIGAAVAANAGVTNDDIGNRVTNVQLIDRSGRQERKTRESLQFGFRRSNLEDTIIAEIELQLDSSDAGELTRRMQACWIMRRAAQPPAGSRVVQALIEPNGTNLADVLESAGVKGLREGEVALCGQYPGFVMVSGGATSKQVLALLGRVTRAVEAATGIQLQSQLKIW